MFFGRKAELEKLNHMYASDKFEFSIVYGRRRVGKTTLIEEFCKGKKTIFFVSCEADEKINLENFSHQVYYVLDKKNAGNSFFSSWDKALSYIYEASKTERIILAMDEYPYLAESYRPISSILQAHIDHYFQKSKLFLILCGSSMSFMEYQVLGYKSPLYGRRTAQFKILPFNFFESLPFLSGFDSKDKAVIYGVTGGTPEYLKKIDHETSLKENIVNLFLNPSGHFFEEPTNLIKQELREPSTYNGILKAIAEGASKLNEISTKNINMESSKCAKYLRVLIDLGIVKKEFPVTETYSKKSIYLLDDQMFRFWYRFVFPNMSTIVSGFGEQLYDNEVEPKLSHFMGIAFEQICKQYFFELLRRNELPFFIGKIGRWWGNDNVKKCEAEIDLMSFRDENALFAECKWTNEKVNIDVLNTLIYRSKFFKYKNNYFYLFAKSDFTKQCVDKAKEDLRIKLITFDEIIEQYEQYKPK
ncbi:ATPase [Clostridia bacterium]|nr:ATPase [Clostridia bacterium]